MTEQAKQRLADSGAFNVFPTTCGHLQLTPSPVYPETPARPCAPCLEQAKVDRQTSFLPGEVAMLVEAGLM